MTNDTLQPQEETARPLGLLSSQMIKDEKIHFQTTLRHNPWMKKVMMGTGVSFAVLLGIGLWYFNDDATKEDVPIILADAKPHKIKPTEAESSKILHQDKTIYRQLTKAPVDETTVTLDESEPETPQAKAPVFPQEFIESLDKESTHTEMKETDPPSSSPKEILKAEGANPEIEVFTSEASSPPSFEATPSQTKEVSSWTQEEAHSSFKEPGITDVSHKDENKSDAAQEKESLEVTSPDQETTSDIEKEINLSQEALKEVTPHQEPEPEILEPTTIPITSSMDTSDQPTSKADKSYAVQVASIQDERWVPAIWNKIQLKAKDLLGSYTPVIRRVDLGRDRGIFYRIQLGPFSKKEALHLCSALKKKGLHCFCPPY